jgi:lipopolysaccharide/colanic/teichoic acid biosynthesis glycosyltransferase
MDTRPAPCYRLASLGAEFGANVIDSGTEIAQESKMINSWLGGSARRVVVAVVDIGLASSSLCVAFLLRGNFTLDDLSSGYLIEATALASVAAAPAFFLAGTNLALWRYVTIRDFGTLIAGATAAVLGFVALMFLWNRLETVPRAVPVIYWLVLVIALCGARIGYAGLIALLSGRGERLPDGDWEPVLLVGGGPGAALVARLLQMAPQAGWRPVGILDERLTVGRMLDNVPILGGLSDFPRVVAGLTLRGMRPSQVVITAAHDEIGVESVSLLRQQAYAEHLGVTNLPDLLRFRATSPPATFPDRQRLRAAFGRLEHRTYRLFKRFIDVAIGGTVLVLTAPLLGVLAIALRATVGSPVLFHQVRGGFRGQPFIMVKFRTMREAYGADGRLLPDAERTPWVGWLLRRTRLDELPQFWNVLIGNMSIVGPRPLVAGELALLPDHGLERSSVRPGITGWAQVHGGQLLDVQAKVTLDLWYVRHASLALDLKILLLTARMVLLGERAGEHEIALAEAAHAEAS